MINDGARTFEWDAENRPVAIEQSTHRTEFTYDGQSRRVRIVEKESGSTISDHWILWCELEICEERDSAGATITRRFFSEGEQQGSTNYFYTHDHLGSVRELTDGSQSISARYDYNPYGGRSKVSGAVETDRGYTGHLNHASTGLALAPFRVYDDTLGRWISQDPIGLNGGTNFYSYVHNNSLNRTDPFGLQEGTAVGCTAGPIGCAVGGAVDILGGLVVLALTYNSVKANTPSSVPDYPPPLDYHSRKAREKCENNGCKPCIPPVGTIAYRLDTTGDTHRDVPPPHWHLYVMQQSGKEDGCKCQWVDIKDNQGGFGAGTTPPRNTIPIHPATGGGLP